MDRDSRLSKARSTLGRYSPSGAGERVDTMKRRALVAVTLGAILVLIGLSILLFVPAVPATISGSMAFLGVVIIGFGIVVRLTVR